MKCKLRYWFPVLTWMAVIFWMSTDALSAANTGSVVDPFFRFLVPEISSRQLGTVHDLIRKLAHVCEYFLLGILVLRAFRGGSVRQRTLKIAALSLLFVVLYASSDEFHQLFESARTASALDVCIDATGGLIGVAVNSAWNARSQKKSAVSATIPA